MEMQMNTTTLKVFVFSSSLIALTACLNGGVIEACDPAVDESCACEDLDGRACEDPSDLDCECFLIEEETLEEVQEPEDVYRYLLIEDLTNPVAGDAPGADIDAVGLIKADREFYAASVEAFKAGGERNNHADINELLGPPDSECEKKNFVSLGGQAFGGYAMLSFGTTEEDVTIENGDSINVYEIGTTMCPGTRFDNDPYRVSVSVSDDLGAFIEMGTGGDGKNIIPVTGL
jgi:hypothetical protein